MAAKRFELNERRPGERNGPLGAVAIEILELFANLVNFKSGRLEPSLLTIMRYVKRSKDAVVRALKALRDHGFLDWLRRYEPTGNVGRGPQVQQASNAYRLSLPERARRLLGRIWSPPPAPDDFDHEQQERAAALEAYRQSLSLDQRTLFDVGDNDLGQSLARLARSIKQRESAKQAESRSSSIPIRKE